ncbi:MAG TPA: PQQ-binding-like beta-propeller repeat protein [Chloroflexota bacterium]
MLAVGLGVLLLAACGGGASPESSPGTPPVASAQPSAKPAVSPASAKPAASPSTAASAKPAASAPASASANPAASGSVQAATDAGWTVYHGNPGHTGVGPSDPAIAAPKQAWSTAVDGVIYAEPLVAGGRVFVVTENDTAYALDANDGKVVWQQHVGEPVPRSALPCGNIDPSGFTATPAIDTSNGLLYAVGRLQPTHHELYAFDLAGGQVKFHRAIDPPGADPRYLQERSAVVAANGRVYVAFGGNFGDCGPYKGWLLAAPPDSATRDVANWAVPTDREGAIWAPPGPAVDANGDLLVAIGNAASTSQFDYGNAVVRLSPDLKPKDYWAPSDWADLSRRDADIGSISPTILQGDQVFQSGKNGTGYLLRGTKLGNIGGELFKAPVCRAAFSGTAYAPPMLYVPCTDGLMALRVGSGTFDVAWHAAAQASNTAPIVAYGSVWQVDPNGALLQFDPSNGQLRNRAPLPTPVTAHFLTPAAAGGKVFVTSGKNVLALGG